MTPKNITRGAQLLAEWRAAHHERSDISRGQLLPPSREVWEDFSHYFRDERYYPHILPAMMEIIAQRVTLRIKTLHAELVEIGVSPPFPGNDNPA